MIECGEYEFIACDRCGHVFWVSDLLEHMEDSHND